ncbi:autophagy-related protein 11 [Nitzschia inconspicua]|uniref:Autophagy-related protein 11 n=1 Tax=Nitzschia inconspicua TaxID=303405 RepID=A0A9K3M6U5_9STRA|nr:autophagy-related protein 11 [Nitzschia inconspicua]
MTSLLPSSSSSPVTIRVLAASTGVTYRMSLHPAELTVASIRNHLAAAVPPNDQILLLGPPYKVPKDTTLQSLEILSSLRLGDKEDEEAMNNGGGGGGLAKDVPTTITQQQSDTQSNISQSQQRSLLSATERSGARRLFLFSKQALSENAPEPPPCVLGPMNVTLPTEPSGSSPLTMTQSAIASQPLHQALSAYERQFMLYLCQGRVLADAADLRLQSCKQCVQEQAVMARALRAAVSNLSDHFNGAARTRSEFTSLFQTKTAVHTLILQRFESILSALGNIPLHPSLVAIARGSGRIMESLLDTVPVERERAWAQQCQTSHDRLLTLFSELETAFGGLGTPASREEETRKDLLAEERIQQLSDEVQGAVQGIRDRQAQRLQRLTADHSKVLKIIMDAINAEVEHGKEDEVQNAFTPLRQISNDAKDIVPEMETDEKLMIELTKKVADAKTEAMKRMKTRLREVSVAQSSIQRVLSSVGVLKAALTQQCDNMVHLEHVAELATSYRDFLSELRRRRAYGQAVTSNSMAMMERLAVMRADEVKAREKFLRGPGRHLMPPFFEIFVPTLATPPPLFTPQIPALAEMDTLPDIGVEDIEDAVMHATTEVGGGVSSASSLTAESHQVPQEKVSVSSVATGTDEALPSASASAHNQQEQLIVSAEENVGNEDVIMDPANGADEAERKTLAYENAILRQTLERLGGKPPKAYIEETRMKDAANEEVAALKKELELAKANAKAAEEALMEAKKANEKPSDKISHSSFDVGDVGLFMPTGRGSGGKRTYLAFHTNCPHRYLSTDNIEGSPDFVLGRIVYQEALVAGEAGTAANPYGLHAGTKFWVLTVEVLKS